MVARLNAETVDSVSQFEYFFVIFVGNFCKVNQVFLVITFANDAIQFVLSLFEFLLLCKLTLPFFLELSQLLRVSLLNGFFLLLHFFFQGFFSLILWLVFLQTFLFG
jgi:hypothetical protein